jgi:hypothetical protein
MRYYNFINKLQYVCDFLQSIENNEYNKKIYTNGKYNIYTSNIYMSKILYYILQVINDCNLSYFITELSECIDLNISVYENLEPGTTLNNITVSDLANLIYTNFSDYEIKEIPKIPQESVALDSTSIISLLNSYNSNLCEYDSLTLDIEL